MRMVNHNKTKGARVMKTKCKVGNLKKVISDSKDENDLISLKKMGLFSYELKYSKMFGPLKKVKSMDGAKAWAIHNAIWKNSKFGEGLK